MVGNYTFYTYIAPVPHRPRSACAPEYLSVVLFAYGIAGALGLVLAGTVFAKHTRRRPGDRPRGDGGRRRCRAPSRRAVLWVSLAGVVFWGLAFGLVPPLLQTRLLHTASARIRDTASAFYTTAFNVGIGGGALLGALLLDWRGLSALPVANIVLVLVGLVVVLVNAVPARGGRARR